MLARMRVEKSMKFGWKIRSEIEKSHRRRNVPKLSAVYVHGHDEIRQLCWAEIQQLALIGSSSSLHSEACNALGASDGIIHSSISHEAVSLRAETLFRVVLGVFRGV